MKEILKTLTEAMTLPPDSYPEQDAEFTEIFVEEIEEIFVELQPLIEQWMQSDNNTMIADIRRHFHTLKGSGRMVGAKSSAELAWTVEDTLNRVINQALPLTLQIQQYVQLVFKFYFYKLADDFKRGQAHRQDFRPLVLLGQQLQQQQSLEPALEELLQLAEHLDVQSVTGLELETVVAAEPEWIDQVIIDEQDENDRIETETLSLFVEEAEEHLATIDQFLAKETHQADNYNALIRALHTLRGSSAMAHIDAIFDASTKVEHLFKVLLQEELAAHSDESQLLGQYHQFVREYLKLLAAHASTEQFDVISRQFDQVWEDYILQHAEQLPSQMHSQGLVSQLLQLDITELLDVELDFEQQVQLDSKNYLQRLVQQAELLLQHSQTQAMLGLHRYTAQLKESYEFLLQEPILFHEDIFELYQQAHQQFIQLFDELAAGQRVSLSESHQHTLDGLVLCIQHVKQQALDAIAHASVEQQVEAEVTTPDTALTLDGVPEVIEAEVTRSPEPVQILSPAGGALSQSMQLDRQSISTEQTNRHFDTDLLDIFLEEADELLVGMDNDLNTWINDPQDIAALNNLMRYLHTLKGGANMVQATHIGLIAHELESIYQRLIQKQLPVSAVLIDFVRLVQDDLADRVQIMHDQQLDYAATNTIDALQHVASLSEMAEPFTMDLAFEASESSALKFEDEPTLELAEPLSDLAAFTQDVQHVQNCLEPIPEELSTTEPEVIETETVDIPVTEAIELETIADVQDISVVVEQAFKEEAEELLASAEILLRQWFEQRNNRSVLLQLQRSAHSLKGGARMLGLNEVQTIAYRLENAFEQFALQHFSANLYDNLLETTLVWLKDAIFKQDMTHYDDLNHRLENMQFVETALQSATQLNQTDWFSPEQVATFVQGDGTEPPAMSGEWAKAEQLDQNNEMIRVSADLIEKMIDLSGENAINRSRIEMDLSQFGHTLVEMELAIHRLADQLRRMEGELESQIIAKHDIEHSRYSDFDPLEMDQYSSLNQLSKSLAESASDLVDFKTTLAEKIRDTESLLLQQSRVQAEIQQGLMRTRLVPFSRLLPRLQRIVRQISSTLNRPAELFVNNTEGELDRTTLERLTTPLEHMLRNAIDHGLEDREQRRQANKPEMGRIELNIHRQGTDVVVTFSDDGGGIDVEKVRQKALSSGLIHADQQLEQQDILQLIFHPGLSTAEHVTQISGRGVGLDVVHSEIKALGGHVSVTSTHGQGTTFTIRVPTTVAVSDALMVKVGDQQFAIPLTQIERIVRVSPIALEQHFESENELFEIDQQPYSLRYLSEFVGGQSVPRLNGVMYSLPVLMMKANHGQTVAVLVDQLIGSRAQIVVKPIGQQFSAIGAIAGATILGDGQVCLILDGQNIARQVQATPRHKQNVETTHRQREADERRLIMIVDDSVTVRKVTSRLLERQGFDVVTAKDGVDAIEQLENIKPDLMLLDIEMPRMDGFEVTNLVRHHDLHQDMPIIMITSRTGEKHRERALSLGVNQYMGKPFQEEDLLHNIETLLMINERGVK